MSEDNVKDLREARLARARKRIAKALYDLSEEDRAAVIERALSELKAEEP